MRATISPFLVLASSTTLVTAFNATTQYEVSTLAVNHTERRESESEWDKVDVRLNVGIEQYTNDTGPWATEKLWLQTPEGGEVCNTRYAMCALAFRGALRNKDINSLFADDTGDCLGAVDSSCLREIGHAAGQGILNHHQGVWKSGDVEEACLSLTQITIPKVCSNASATKDLWTDPIAKLILPPDRECNKSEVTINSYGGSGAKSDDVLAGYDNMILGITPVVLVAHGGLNLSEVPMPEWDSSEYANSEVKCTRPENIASGSREPVSDEKETEEEDEDEPNAGIPGLEMRSFSLFFVGVAVVLSSVFLVAL